MEEGACTYAPLWRNWAPTGLDSSIPLEGSRCFTRSVKGKLSMPRYFFIARRTATETYDPHGTVLSDNAAAFAHAESIIEDLRKIGGFNDDLTIDVKNDLDERVLSMPFLPACA
jgi:hypothetical protein